MTRRWLFALVLAACGGGGADGGDDDAPGDCTAGETRCQGNTFQVCSDGTYVTGEFCGGTCHEDLGCLACTPNLRYCDGEVVYECTSDGRQGAQVELCTGNAHCTGGACVDPCVTAAETRSYLGCEYWAVDLDNAHDVYTTPEQIPLFGCQLIPTPVLTGPICYDPDSTTPDPVTGGMKTTAGLCDPGPTGPTCPTSYACTTTQYCGLNAQTSPFAIVVSNPQTYAVMVTLTDGAGMTSTQSLQPGAVQPIFPQQLGFADASIDHTMQGKKAYRLTSTAPVVAYQFNPLDNVNVFSNDASLLIPRTAFDRQYIAMTWKTEGQRPGSADYDGYVAIVAWQDDTTITVTPSVDTKPGYGTPAIPAITAGTPTTFTLDAFEVLNLAAVGNADLTGTIITAMDPAKTVGVFGGTEAAYTPHASPPAAGASGPCCADHLEEMLFPTSTWGKEFAVARSQVRLMQVNEPDVIKVLAQRAGTVVTFTPNPVSGSCGTLGVGQACTVEIANDTIISATEPVMVGHVLKSVLWTSGLGTQMYGTGDPSMAIVPPTEQFRTTYAILVPQQYMASYVSIVAPATGAVLVDTQDVSGQLTSTFGGFRAGRIAVSPGPHRIDCPGTGCGVEVYGWSRAVSYMFAGGLDLQQIVIGGPPLVP